MATTVPLAAAPPVHTRGLLDEARRRADALFSWLLLAHFPIALALAPLHDTWGPALVAGSLLSIVPLLLVRWRRGTLLSRAAVAVALMGYSALYIHQTRGLIEAHFHVLVCLAFLLAYRDWRAPVIAAITIALHHSAFHLLQHSGTGVWVFGHASGFGTVAIHIAFVVFETAGLAHLAVQQQRSTQVADRLVALSNRLADGDLDVATDRHPTLAALGRVAETVRVLVDATHAMTLAARTGTTGVQRVPVTLQGAFASMLRDLDDTTSTLRTLQRQAAQEADAARAFAGTLGAVLAQVRGRDLTPRLGAGHPAPYDAIATALDDTLVQLGQTMAEVQGAGEQITAASAQIADGSDGLARGAVEQSTALTQIADSMQEVATASAANANAAHEAQQLADAARASAQAGVERMTRLVDAVGTMKAGADSTARIVRTIDEIAFQTNLLALNAAVEAARAGDAGRGFAVVAQEVRALALRSAEAAKNTASLITESLTSAESGAALAREVAVQLDEIDQRVRVVGEVTERIAVASATQDHATKTVRGALSGMHALVDASAASAEQSASAAQQLSAHASNQLALVGSFTVATTAVAAPSLPPFARHRTARARSMAR